MDYNKKDLEIKYKKLLIKSNKLENLAKKCVNIIDEYNDLKKKRDVVEYHKKENIRLKQNNKVLHIERDILKKKIQKMENKNMYPEKLVYNNKFEDDEKTRLKNILDDISISIKSSNSRNKIEMSDTKKSVKIFLNNTIVILELKGRIISQNKNHN